MDRQEHVLPYLARFAISRTEIEPVGGWYSQETAMWMLDTANGPQPVIECDSALPEMTTKTHIQSEADDDKVLELSTKTRVQAERDDEPLPKGFDI